MLINTLYQCWYYERMYNLMTTGIHPAADQSIRTYYVSCTKYFVISNFFDTVTRMSIHCHRYIGKIKKHV